MQFKFWNKDLPPRVEADDDFDWGQGPKPDGYDERKRAFEHHQTESKREYEEYKARGLWGRSLKKSPKIAPEDRREFMKRLVRDTSDELTGLGSPQRIASESKTVEEYARRVEAWNSSEAKPQSLTKLARAWAGGREGPKVMRLLREAREAREEGRERLWSRAARGLRGAAKSIAEVRDEMKKLGVDEMISERDDAIHVGKIVVPKGARGSGVGTKVMQSLVEYADKTDKRITLTPSTDFGASSVARLKKFYKRFGFVENKGRNKDYSIRETMFRLPR
jgi:GNAT superfamily N-acetyltransferase